MADAILSGAMFYPGENDCERSTKCNNAYNFSMNCFKPKEGGRYNHYSVQTEKALELLHRIFPEGLANDSNFVLFSTSGIHGSYMTIEELEHEMKNPPESEEDERGNDITFVIVQPLLCTLHYGNCTPENPGDLEFLKKLRQSSWDAVLTIGKHCEG